MWVSHFRSTIQLRSTRWFKIVLLLLLLNHSSDFTTHLKQKRKKKEVLFEQIQRYTRSLKEMGNQWRQWWRGVVLGAKRPGLVATLARQFCTLWRLSMSLTATPGSRKLQSSSLLDTRADTIGTWLGPFSMFSDSVQVTVGYGSKKVCKHCRCESWH